MMSGIEERPATADEIRYDQDLGKFRNQIRSIMQDSQELVMIQVDSLIKDCSQFRASLTNTENEISRLTSILDKHKIPHEKKIKRKILKA